MFNGKKIARLEESNRLLTEFLEHHIKARGIVEETLSKALDRIKELAGKVEPKTLKVYNQTAIDLAYKIRNECKTDRDSKSIGGKEYYRIPVSFIDGVILEAKDEVELDGSK